MPRCGAPVASAVNASRRGEPVASVVVDASRRNLEVSDAWLFESKLGLQQMLSNNRPFEQQSLAVFSMLAANAPPLPAADTSWWCGEYTLRSSHALAEWLDEESDQQLLESSVVSISVDERVELRMQLACGLSLLLEGAIEVRAVGAAAMITLTFDDANFYRVRAENNEAMVSPMDVAGLLQECESDLRWALPSAEEPVIVKLRPLFVDGELMLLREASTRAGRTPLQLVLSRNAAPPPEPPPPPDVSDAAAELSEVLQEEVGQPKEGPRMRTRGGVARREQPNTLAGPRFEGPGAPSEDVGYYGLCEASNSDAAAQADAGPAAPPELADLARRARSVRARWEAGDAHEPAMNEFRVDHRDDNVVWLLDRRLLLGSYPVTPVGAGAAPTPSSFAPLRRLTTAGVTCFAAVDEAVPSQADDAWTLWGAPDETRFVRYATYANRRQRINGRPRPLYLHCSIIDGAAPSIADDTDDGSVLLLLDRVLAHLEGDGRAAYVHGGADSGDGRAALVGCCLVALLRQPLDADAVIGHVEAAYVEAGGAARMSERQREFVREFVGELSDELSE